MTGFDPAAHGLLDWRHCSVGAGVKPCRLCRKPAFMRDDHGLPCHLVCAQAEHDKIRPRTPEGHLGS